MDAVTFQFEAKRIEKLLYHVAWTYLGNNQDVEDAVQDALTKAWEKQGALRNQGYFKFWLTKILVNQCKDILRTRRRMSYYPLEEETVTVEFSAEESSVSEAMSQLKPEQRIVISLFYMDGYTQQDIAEMLGCPVGTVKTRLHSARKQLKKILLVEWEE
ncbi:MAG: RNA polymerase sigma factor [Clostridia bacterium]|nr:RNA polymerase sigma factor [Clostridia bacterium]